MIALSKEYLRKRTDLLIQESDYFKENSIALSNADYTYANELSNTNKITLSEREYEKLMPEDVKKVIKDRNTFLENIDTQLYMLDQKYQVDALPVLYYNIEELKAGLEESIEILADYDHLMEGKSEPKMKGYTKEDFYHLLNERITAEKNVLKELNGDPNPDLFQYALKLYQEREAHPVIY